MLENKTKKVTWTTTNILLGVWLAALVGGIVYWTFWGGSGSASAKPVPDVTMQTIQGEPYALRNPAGKVRLLSFIYTRCPDICPMTTVKMVELQNRLKQENMWGNQVEFVTVTIDPENDTPQALQAYAKKLNIDPSGWRIVRGSDSQTKEVTQGFTFYAQKMDGGLISHTSATYLIDEENMIRQKYGMGEGLDTETVLADLMKMAKKGR